MRAVSSRDAYRHLEAISYEVRRVSYPEAGEDEWILQGPKCLEAFPSNDMWASAGDRRIGSGGDLNGKMKSMGKYWQRRLVSTACPHWQSFPTHFQWAPAESEGRTLIIYD